MNLTEFCLKKPVLLAVVVIFMILAGIWSLLSIPIQLTPDVETPQITVRTLWPGASPYEVEREIVQKQEEFLNNLPNLVRLNSESQPGYGNINLEFEIGTDMNDALVRISNELNQVPSYPENALRPTIIASGANSSPIIWMALRTVEGNTRSIRTYKEFAEEQIKPELEKIPGVSEARVYGARDMELQIRFDPVRLSRYGISLNELIGRIRAENVNVSGGLMTQGKREYTIRTVSRFHDPKDMEDMIVRASPQGNVYLRDLAQVRIGHAEHGTSVLSDEGLAIIVPIYKEAGINVLEITRQVSATLERLNAGLLKQNQLVMKSLSDPEYYINSAIGLVLNNLMLGGFLAIGVLYLFLGNLRSALVVALSIPISIIGTFLFMMLLGRNINVISLAGLAFAVGMVMDAAIVVAENIDKMRAQGKPLFPALVEGTKQVYGAILASSLTTVAVFLPVVFVKDQAGQLFKDIAIAICCAIMLSFLVSSTVIPPIYRAVFSNGDIHGLAHINPLTRLCNGVARRMVNFLIMLLDWVQARLWRKLVVVVGITAASAVVGLTLQPKQEYLPGGNRNLLLSILFPPPGYSPQETEDIGRTIIDELRPAIDGKLPGYPKIGRTFMVGFGTTLIMGTVSEDPKRVQELIPLINRAIFKVPGLRGFTSQTSLFERGLAAGRSIDVEIYGADITTMAGITGALFAKVNQIIPGSQIRPIPSFDLGNPEVRIIPNLERAAAAGLTTAELGLIVDIYTDGRKIDEFTLPTGETIDLTLSSATDHLRNIADFETQPLLAPNNNYVTIGSVADVVETVGPQQINRIDGNRVFTLRVLPPPQVSLEEALAILQEQLATPAAAEYAKVPGFRVALTGTADAFTKTRQSLQTGFLLAIAITVLLLVILFEDLLSPLVIIAALPVAAAGGFIGLWLVNTFVAPQPLDMLTMLGFLMMIGIVVNNPILIVSRALDLMRGQNWPLMDAVREAVKSRIRPIFMTTLTSVFGLLPLVLMPGAGSELYRGLGSAVLGGLVLSTVVSMLFVPSLFSLIQDLQALFRPKAPAVDEAGLAAPLATEPGAPGG